MPFLLLLLQLLQLLMLLLLFLMASVHLWQQLVQELRQESPDLGVLGICRQLYGRLVCLP
jgi:hypothetical protein